MQVPVGHSGEVYKIIDAISYSKGASVIRMLHDYVGGKVNRLRKTVSFKLGKKMEKDVLCLVTSMRKSFESHWGIKPQTFAFHALSEALCEKRYALMRDIFRVLMPFPNLIQDFAGYSYLQFMFSWFLVFNPKEWLKYLILSYNINSESQTVKAIKKMITK